MLMIAYANSRRGSTMVQLSLKVPESRTVEEPIPSLIAQCEAAETAAEHSSTAANTVGLNIIAIPRISGCFHHLKSSAIGRFCRFASSTNSSAAFSAPCRLSSVMEEMPFG